MTKNEAVLRQALLACQAALAEQTNTEVVAAALRQADNALRTEPTPAPVFYASREYVRGPARPDGSGLKEMVFKLQSPAIAQRTAENLSALFAEHCIRAAPGA